MKTPEEFLKSNGFVTAAEIDRRWEELQYRCAKN